MTEIDRRAVLRGTVAAGAVGIGATSGVVGRPERGGDRGGGPAGLRGRVQRANGKPAGRDSIAVAGREFGFDYVQTNRGGVFTADVTGPERVALGYYQTTPGFTRRPAPVRDGSPDIFTLPDAEVSAGPTNLGTVSLPEAFLVDVVVKDTDGDPVEGAQFRVVSFAAEGGGGFGTGSQRTNAEGRLQYADADFAGTELAGEVKVQIAPPDAERLPSDDPRVRERRFTVTEPRTERFVLDV